MRIDTSGSVRTSAGRDVGTRHTTAPDRQLCADGGLSVSCWSQPILTLHNAQLRALDLLGCPDLVEVDISCSQQAEVHLTLRDCPNLRTIRLPPDASAFLHVDNGAVPPLLEIDGCVALIDACWIGGKFSKRAQTDGNWSQVLIAPISRAERPNPRCERVLRVITGAPDDAARLELEAPDGAPRDLLLAGMRMLEQLLCRGPALNSLEVLDAPRLADVESLGNVRHLMLKKCPALRRLHGGPGGQQLDLHERSGAPSGLAVELPYAQITIADSDTARLEFKHRTSLSLYRCHSVRQVQIVKGSKAYCEGCLPADLAAIADFGIDESSIRHQMERIRQGEPDAWPGLRWVLTIASGTDMVAKALRGLAEAMHFGIDPAEVWQTRLELYARHRDRSLKPTQPVPESAMGLGGKSWAWRMAPDLAADGWRADWLIWRHCAEAGVAQANAALPAMGAELLNRTDVVPYLMPWLFRSPQIESPQTIDFLLRLLTLGTKKERSGLASGEIGRELRLLMRAPEQSMQVLPRRHELALKVHTYLLAVLPAGELLVYLAQWLLAEPGAARTKILQLAAKPPGWDRLGQMSAADFGRAARTLILTGRLPALAAKR